MVNLNNILETLNPENKNSVKQIGATRITRDRDFKGYITFEDGKYIFTPATAPTRFIVPVSKMSVCIHGNNTRSIKILGWSLTSIK